MTNQGQCKIERSNSISHLLQKSHEILRLRTVGHSMREFIFILLASPVSEQ